MKQSAQNRSRLAELVREDHIRALEKAKQLELEMDTELAREEPDFDRVDALAMEIAQLRGLVPPPQVLDTQKDEMLASLPKKRRFTLNRWANIAVAAVILGAAVAIVPQAIARAKQIGVIPEPEHTTVSISTEPAPPDTTPADPAAETTSQQTSRILTGTGVSETSVSSTESAQAADTTVSSSDTMHTSVSAAVSATTSLSATSGTTGINPITTTASSTTTASLTTSTIQTTVTTQSSNVITTTSTTTTRWTLTTTTTTASTHLNDDPTGTSRTGTTTVSTTVWPGTTTTVTTTTVPTGTTTVPDVAAVIAALKAPAEDISDPAAQLTGAKIQLLTLDGTLISEWVTDGAVRQFPLVYRQNYRIHVVSAPDGWIAPHDIIFGATADYQIPVLFSRADET